MSTTQGFVSDVGAAGVHSKLPSCIVTKRTVASGKLSTCGNFGATTGNNLNTFLRTTGGNSMRHNSLLIMRTMSHVDHVPTSRSEGAFDLFGRCNVSITVMGFDVVVERDRDAALRDSVLVATTVRLTRVRDRRGSGQVGTDFSGGQRLRGRNKRGEAAVSEK